MSRAQGQGTMRGKQRGDRRGGWRGGGSGQPVCAGGTGCVIFPKPGLLLPPSSCTARRARKPRSARFSVGRSVGLSACLCSRPRRLARPLVVPGDTSPLSAHILCSPVRPWGASALRSCCATAGGSECAAGSAPSSVSCVFTATSVFSPLQPKHARHWWTQCRPFVVERPPWAFTRMSTRTLAAACTGAACSGPAHFPSH